MIKIYNNLFYYIVVEGGIGFKLVVHVVKSCSFVHVIYLFGDLLIILRIVNKKEEKIM